MTFNQSEEDLPVGIPPPAGIFDNTLPVILLLRDYRLWLLGVMHYWYFLAIVPVVLFVVTFVLMSLLVKPEFASSCALVRHEIKENSSVQSGIPKGYNPLQTAVVLNMLRSRANMQQTIDRLGLRVTPNELYEQLSIEMPNKSSNYIYLTGHADSSELAAKIANTQAEVFIEDYKRLIRENLSETLTSLVRNYSTLEDEITALTAKIQAKEKNYRIFSIDAELGKLNGQIINTENMLQSDQAGEYSLKSEISTLKAALANTPEEVQVYEERSIERQAALLQEKMNLARLRQAYTEDNPLVQKKLELVQIMERELAEESKSQSKLVFGKNMVYINIATEISKKEMQLAGTISRLKEHQIKLQSLRAELDKVTAMRPEFQALTNNIEQKKQAQSLIQEARQAVEMFMDRSYSDITIYEPASPFNGPKATKKLTVSGAVGIVGFCLTGLLLLILEGLNFTVRSRVDVEKALQVKMLGATPVLKTDSRSLFYGSLQMMMDQAELLLQSVRRPINVAVASFPTAVVAEKMQQELLQLLDVRNYRMLLIRAVLDIDSKNAEYLINDYLYGLSDTPPKPNRSGELLFMLDEMAFLAPPSEARFELLREHIGSYDIVVWNLFEYGYNKQLFLQICRSSDMTVIPLEFGVSNKSKLALPIRELREAGVRNVVAGVREVNDKFYYLVR